MPSKTPSTVESAPARTGRVADAEQRVATAQEHITAVRAATERLAAARAELGESPDDMSKGMRAYKDALDAWQQRASGLQQQWIAAQSQEREAQRALASVEGQLTAERQRRDQAATVAAEWTATLEAWRPLLVLSDFHNSAAVQAARTARTRPLSDAVHNAHSALLGCLGALIEAHAAALAELARYDGEPQ